MTFVKLCPRCHENRPIDEIVCGGLFLENLCRWSLHDVLPSPACLKVPSATEEEAVRASASSTATEAPTALPINSRQCLNGHDINSGDFICLACGEPAAVEFSEPSLEIASGEPPVAPVIRVAGRWTLGGALGVISGESDLYLATSPSLPDEGLNSPAVFKHYRRGIDPETSLYPALRSLDPDHGLRLLDAGRFEDRAFEVWEYLPLGTLGAIPATEKAHPDFVREVLREVGSALHGLAEVQIIHRDLKPANLLVRSRSPLDLVLADFSTATVSEFDLQLTITRQTTRYAGPETIVGTCSPASDWWSLGVIILELLTEGRNFEGVHERAFLLHLVTRGLEVPTDLPEDWQELLMGLLTREPARRWSWNEVERWLGGERGIPHGYVNEVAEFDDARAAGNTLRLGQRNWSTPESFALAAAESSAWMDARDILLSGRLATWLDQRGGTRDENRAAQVRELSADLELPEDARLSLALLILNENLPLCLNGEIVTPPWILRNPEVALSWLDSSLPNRLGRIIRETWFVRLRERADRVRARLRETKIVCDSAQISAALLATSTAMLESRWKERRRLFPEAEIPALQSIIARRSLTEEDLIILVSAPLDSFRSASEILDEAEREALLAGISFSREASMPWLERSRREIVDALSERLNNFVRSNIESADHWADDFRLDRRITLARALVILAIPVDQWQEPPRQEYVRNLLSFFHRRLVTALQRGPLVRMTIGRSTSRIDLTELTGTARTAEDLLVAIIGRHANEVSIDPTALLTDENRERRLRRLVTESASYQRDTGISALYLGFPFITLRGARASEGTKPRIAPLLLWPIHLEMPQGSRGSARLGYDLNRDEIRINPALAGILGDLAPAWREALDDLRGRDSLDLQSTLDALRHLATFVRPPLENEQVAPLRLLPLPPKSIEASLGQIQLHPSAVLFHSDFTGQTIAEDLKQLGMVPIQGTALESVLRAGLVGTAEGAPEQAGEGGAGEANPPTGGPSLPAEVDRYFTAASDPSQQSAVFQSRIAPGLVVQGPPGTGKSQTIVNIVCDAIGRGEKVLIVCQKLAALDVVRKRLEAEGLAQRIFFLKDTIADRKPALQSLREQLEQPRRTKAEHSRLIHHREGLAKQIEAIEAELNQAHQALRETSPDRPGHLSYRETIDRLLQVEKGPALPVSFTALGFTLGALDYAQVERLIAEVAPLSGLWRDAQYEQSALECLISFRTDAAALEEFFEGFSALKTAETERDSFAGGHRDFFEVEDPETLEKWINEHEVALRALPLALAQSLARWENIFIPEEPEVAHSAERCILWLKHLEELIGRANLSALSPSLYEKLAEWGTSPLERLGESVQLSSRPCGSIFARLNPARWLAKRSLTGWIRATGVDPDSVDPSTLLAAIEMELKIRPDRLHLDQWREALGDVASEKPLALPLLKATIRRLLEQLEPVNVVARRILSCPVVAVAHALRQSGDPQGCGAVLERARASVALAFANRKSLGCLDLVAPWFNPKWLEGRKDLVAGRLVGRDVLVHFEAALPTLVAFQNFRLRAKSLSPESLAVFALLRKKETTWEAIPLAVLASEITRTLRREALLAWKSQAEIASPSLLMSHLEIIEKVKMLAAQDELMREANRELLAKCSEEMPIKSRADWDDVVMLTGPRARKLREVVDRGNPLGLFHLRPVWMVHPEMVSRLFPLQGGLFDLVIFDEASQLPVESVLPALFRAKRVIVSGDEKQMPPSRFFGSELESDEAEEEDEWNEEDAERLDDQERDRLAQAAGRREVKDSTDLLALTQNLLSTTTLEIHYRSKYRELIAFSNAAFYGGRLSVPARHPMAEILRAAPLEVDRVDGVYANQTNETEAKRVAWRLQELWRRPIEERPSVGVVTFNLKQKELIEDHLEALAEVDEEFRVAWQAEQARVQRGEDMGFFVKNLENVQGDERDWMIFSTTFGRDARGGFRRNFGVLGQAGGERRLNVAITRAREKVVVITSLPLAEISTWTTNQGTRPPATPRDFLQGWLAYAERLHAGQFAQSQTILQALNEEAKQGGGGQRKLQAGSALIDEVEDFLRQMGHEAVRAAGDAFGVDFALIDPRTGLYGLGIECDAPDHPALRTARAREIWRPAVLARSIPQMHRVSSRDWYEAKANEQDRLREAVKVALGE